MENRTLEEEVLDDITVMPNVDYVPRKAALQAMQTYYERRNKELIEWLDEKIEYFDPEFAEPYQQVKSFLKPKTL